VCPADLMGFSRFLCLFTRVMRQLFLRYRFVCKTNECLFCKVSILVVHEEESICVPKKPILSEESKKKMTKKSSLIDAEPNRYVHGRQRERSWGNSKTHLGFRIPADSVSGPLRSLMLLAPMWHAWGESRSRLDFSVLAIIF
jgi:hypothetical protein